MSELNFGLKISTFKINININIDEKSNIALANLLKDENNLQEASISKDKAQVDFHYAGCSF